MNIYITMYVYEYVYNRELEIKVEIVIEIEYVSVKALIISTYHISNTHPTHTSYR